MYVYMQLIHFAIQEKQMQHCKATILHKFFFKKRKSCSLQDPLSIGRHEHPSLQQTNQALSCRVLYFCCSFSLECFLLLLKKSSSTTFLVVQWIRICLPSRGHRFNLWSGKIPHATEQLSPCPTPTDPTLHVPCVQSQGSTTREATAVRSLCTTAREQPPLSSTREKLAQQ